VIIVVVLLFCVYFLLGYSEDRNIKIIFAILFVLISFVIKFSIDVTKTADYDNYLYIIALPGLEISLKTVFSEPYFFHIGRLLYEYFPKEKRLAFFTESSFIYTTVFFIWLAYLKNISTFNKVIIFSLYYYFFSYIVYRNGPAYMLSGVCFYYLHKDRYLKITPFLLLAHLSSLPVIIFSIFKNKLGDKKLLVLCFLFIISFSLLIQIELFGIYEKFLGYKEEAVFGQNIFHKVYFYSFVTLTIFLYLFKKDLIYNYTYLLLFVTYLILNYSNSVMGYRFSIYLTLYLALNPKLFYGESVRKKLFFVLPIFLLLFVFNHLTLQK
jgi:hypothetical protein